MTATISTEPKFANLTLADIATSLPGATAVLRRNKLDFCCGGRVSLAEAAEAKGLPLADIEAELASIAALTLPPEKPDSTEDVIALIEARYHAGHRRELPELTRLARRVEAVHKAHSAVPSGLADLLETITTELEDHMQKEEQVLFPLMRRGGHPMISQPIAMMLAEHDDHGAHLRRMEALTDDFTPPGDACPTWRALYVGTRKLADDLMEHIHIENNILFPRFLR
ncbi:MAG TPA: iron-sulfur cluster repair protein YtfE [Rhodopila sp.]|jgi:regulator of cell morphogenesis and NO signaling|nr:iron-sulfur cluster repair protein YtfE [Rhodopila sp.]